MKHKLIEKAPRKRPGKMETNIKYVAAQVSGQYLILDLWKNGKWMCRHATDTQTGEYASCYQGDHKWTEENLENSFSDYYTWEYMDEKKFRISQKDRKLVLDSLSVHWGCRNVYERIQSLESDYSREKRAQKEYRRTKRIRDLMDSVPAPGKAVRDWIAEAAAGQRHYAILDKTSGVFHCTACEGVFAGNTAGAKMKHGKKAVCPLCGHEVTVEKRRECVSMETRLTMIHGLDEKRGIQRHFLVTIIWKGAREVHMVETIRCMLHKGTWSRHLCEIYYEQWSAWDKGNPRNHRWRSGYLYPEGIVDGLAGTHYAAWADMFSCLASLKTRANYDRLMCDTSRTFIGMVEYLAKGRFYRLLEDVSEEVSYYYGYPADDYLCKNGKDIGEVMHLSDRQKINRLRQENGGLDMLEWLQWSDKAGKKISSEVLRRYEKNRITARQYRLSCASKHLSPEQLMNYLERQKEIYGGKKTVRAIFEQYEDYLSMAEKLGKNMDDEMVYRPRELKRRHDEAVEENRKRQEALRLRENMEKAREEAERMEKKYPGSVEILEEVRQKYEYEGKNYIIIVPRNFYEITMEGMALHHCVGNTERYFDRILQHETYICFLRRKEEPEKAFYTIEVEPGGTIRQHRGLYDEEPGIDEIKPFLREWQKEIRRKMGRKDMEHAQLSAVKREQNLEELRQKNNTRVLEALMEDLMEVV